MKKSLQHVAGISPSGPGLLSSLAVGGVLAVLSSAMPVQSAELNGLLRETLARHPSVQLQTSLREAAKSGVQSARWQYYPTPSIAVEQAETGSADPNYQGQNQVITARLQQPLWTGGRLSAGVDKALASEVLAQADLDATRQQLSLRVIQALGEALVANAKLAAHEQNRETHARLLEQVLRRAAEGVSAQSDVDLARSRIASTEVDAIGAQNQRDTALDKLRTLVGRPLAETELLPMSSYGLRADPWVDGAGTGLLRAAYAVSPQLARSRAQARIIESELGLAEAALYPEVYLRLERQQGSYSQAGFSPQTRIFVGLSTNFGAGLSSLSGVDAAKARLRGAQDDIEVQRLAVDEQIQADLMLLRSAAERSVGLQRSRQSGEEVSASWARQFLVGRKQWQDLMNSARELNQTDVQLADAFGAELVARWRLGLFAWGVDGLLARTTP